MPTRDDFTYAAGIVDGEGCISVTEIKVDYEPGNRRRRRKSPQHRVYVAVVMSDSLIPLWLRNTFGGYVNSYSGRQPQHKPFHRWSLANRAAAEFCRTLAPYLKLKRKQAELVATFYDERLTKNARSSGITDDELALRRELTGRIQQLNQRGLVGSVGGGLA